MNCSTLQDIELSCRITELPGSVFAGCISLKSVDIPEGITQILDDAFAGCEQLERIAIPSSVTKIPESAFPLVKLKLWSIQALVLNGTLFPRILAYKMSL